jgi:predicted unusual protein kinase regulating ubiquinone biosynthesis (AarF/ABC1/UbiB family)
MLGESSLGTTVYKGRHHDGRDVAVKVVKKGVASSKARDAAAADTY